MKKHPFHYFATTLCVLLAAFGFIMIARIAGAATNISATPAEHYAWSDVIGWIDFYNTNSVSVTSSQLTGYASSSVGDISLDCATTSIGNICSSSNYKVTNDGLGTLSGYGWSDAFGWISFSCANHGCGTSTYGVAIAPATGFFSNYAWNDLAGWISFNCADIAACGVSNYKVKTSWTATSTSGSVDSTTYDTGITSGGAQVVNIVWQGSLPSGTQVQFQIATSDNTNGPWTYLGPDGTAATAYSGSPDTTLSVSYSAHAGRRYFRYRMTLVSDQAQVLSPRVDDVIVSWTP